MNHLHTLDVFAIPLFEVFPLSTSAAQAKPFGALSRLIEPLSYANTIGIVSLALSVGPGEWMNHISAREESGSISTEQAISRVRP